MMTMKSFDFLPDLEIQTREIELDSFTMTYWELLPEAEEAIIFVHGFSGSKEEWIFQFDFFSKHGYRLIAIDQEGHGGSELSSRKTDMGDLAEDLNEFLEKKGLSQFILVGHSLGGMVCQQYTLLHPEKVEKLVLIGTSPRYEAPPPKKYIEFVRSTDISNVIKTTSSFASIPVAKLPPEQRDFYKKLKKWSIHRRTKAITKEAYIKFLLLTEKKSFNVLEELPRIKVPTLIACGNLDALIRVQNSKLLHEKIENSQLKIFENCGHAPPREYHREFNELMLQFLQG